jgi:hypothetical protein
VNEGGRTQREGGGSVVNLTVELPYATKVIGLAVEHGLIELAARHDRRAAPRHVQLWGVYECGGAHYRYV